MLFVEKGLGASDVMKRSWTRSLQLLLHTRKPVLCTAHSAGDLDRDLAFVDSLVAEDAQDLGEPLEVIQVLCVCSEAKFCLLCDARGGDPLILSSCSNRRRTPFPL